MENPAGNHQLEANHPPSYFNVVYLNDENPAREALGSGLKHNPGISMDWSLEEQAILEDGLKKFASELAINCYTQIAMQLQNKTVRDVALRCRWMSKKETSKRRREELNPTRKSKDRKERVADPSAKTTHFAGQSNSFQNPTQMIPLDYDYAIGGVPGELLEQNAQALNQIRANLATFQIHENIVLLAQTRDNLLRLMNLMNDAPCPDIMKQMPQLPEKLNFAFANAILPPPSPLALPPAPPPMP